MDQWTAHIDVAALEAWMDLQALGNGPISGAHLLGGGTQNMLLRFDRGLRGFVLRRPPPHPHAKSNETMRREMRVLAALAATAVPHPHLLAACPETDVLGAAFYLMEPVDGFNATAGLPEIYGRPDWCRRMAFALVEGIAQLGALQPEAIGLGDFGRPDGFLKRQVPRWRAQFEAYSDTAPTWPGGRALPGIDRVADWLELHRPDHFQPSLMHGDYHFANVLFRFDRPELAAIVDWELATIGDSLMDLGWLLATWPDGSDTAPGPVVVTPWNGFPSAAELIGHYRAHSGRDLSAIDWYIVMGCFKLAILLEGTHVRAHIGKAPKSVGDRLHADAIRLMERAARLTC